MDKNELLHKLTEYEIELLKAKGEMLRAGRTDTSCCDGQINAIEYARTLAMMLDEPEEKPENTAKVPEPEDYYIPVSAFNTCRILINKCDVEITALKESGAYETYDKLRYADIVKLKDTCRRFLTDWEIHDPARS